MSIGQRLTKVRKTLKVSQADIAKLLNCSQPNISEYEKDKIGIPISSLKLIRNTYNINLDWFLTGEGSMFIGAPTKDQISGYHTKRVQDLEKQIDELKKNIQDIENSYNIAENSYSQEKVKNDELHHKNQALNDELTSCLKQLIESKNLIIKLQQK